MAARPFLKFGSRGPAVEDLQRRLLRLGFDPHGIDGDFGQDTEAAVEAFQAKHGLEVDGRVGVETWAAIVIAEGGSTPGVPTSPFAQALMEAAEREWETFHTLNEGDTRLCRRIRTYWDDLGLEFTSCTGVPWSAVFVSWCVKQTGATSDDFLFAAAHAKFVRRAIRNADRNEGVFHGIPFNSSPVQVGDILQNNRGGGTVDFAFARSHSAYISHSAVVVRVVLDGAQSYAVTTGGNEGDSVRHSTVPLTSTGVVKKRTGNPFIAIVRRVG